MDSLGVRQMGDKPSELEDHIKLNSDSLTIQTLEPFLSSAKLQSEQIQYLLEQKIVSAVTPIVESLLGSKAGNQKQIDVILQSIASQIPSVEISHYFRAGRNYYTINHKMGYAGNLFFKSIFDNLIKDKQQSSYHLITQENNICAICRI